MAKYIIAAGLAQASQAAADCGLGIMIIGATLILVFLIGCLALVGLQNRKIKKWQFRATAFCCLMSFVGSLIAIMNFPLETAMYLSLVFAITCFSVFVALGGIRYFFSKSELVRINRG